MISEWLERASERSVLTAFWGLILLCAVATAVPRPYWYVAGGLTQLALLVLWVGYSLTVFSRFITHRFKAAGIALLAFGPIVGGTLALITENCESAALWSLLGLVLFLTPFGAAAHALQVGERKSFGQVRTSLFVASVAFFVLPFFGGFIHSRVRAAIRGLRARPI